MLLIKKELSLSPREYYGKHLAIIDLFLPVGLSPRESEILAEFMSLDLALVEDDRFNTLARKKVKSELKLSDASLSNNLSAMIKKGFLKKSKVTGRITIHELIWPEPENQAYQFKLTKNHDGRDRGNQE